MPHAKDTLDSFIGCILGSAIGDALGYQEGRVEFDSTITPLKPAVDAMTIPGRYSDDTQLSRVVSDGLIEAYNQGACHVQGAGDCIAEEFVQWLAQPHEGSHRAAGGACMHGCHNMAKGVHWRDAGQPVKADGSGGGGCGTVMRSHPYGLYHLHSEPGVAGTWAALHSRMTHMHPMAAAAAAAQAEAIRFIAITARHGLTDMYNLATGMVITAKTYHQGTADKIQLARNMAEVRRTLKFRGKKYMDTAVLDSFRGWAAHEAIAAGVYCAMAHADDFEEAILLAVNSPGDSDSIGAITGALVGAKVGMSNLPNVWRNNVENYDELIDLAHELYAVAEAMR